MEEEKKKSSKKSEFEFCKVCRLHHDQGPRHKYFPRHKELLSAFLDRFRSKIADVRFFLENPSVLRPLAESQNRVWCVFCDEDIVEIGSSFACSKAINHLASSDHCKKVKHFLCKYGPTMDCVDDFRISEADLAKWVRKCTVLGNRDASSCKEQCRQLSVTSNDIHNKLEFETIGLPGVTHYGAHLDVDASHLSLCADPLSHLPGVIGMNSISSSHSSDTSGNFHSGAPPPWLNVNDGNIFSVQLNQSEMTRFQEKKPVKTCMLNPKRVGAAWAERRKTEMEMEKRGQAVNTNTDADWLPNFGRVWQSGTRKESREEFEKEKRNLVKTGSISTESEDPNTTVH